MFVYLIFLGMEVGNCYLGAIWKKKTPKNPQILLHNESSKLETYSPSPVNIEVTLSDMKLKGIAITE